MMYFGTDGIRGVANVDITVRLAADCGNALTTLKKKCRVVIGRDTRVSGDMLLHAFAAGVMQGGGDALDVGVMPTAGIAYLTKKYRADFGVVISASHNPAEYNGIKIFDSKGYKLGEERERKVEQAMAAQNLAKPTHTGRYTFMHNADKDYVKYLTGCVSGLNGLKVLLDCSNGASRLVARQAFEEAGARVVALNTSDAGIDVNDGVGALYAERLGGKVTEGGFDVGFAFDGDSDRLIAVDAEGKVVDGDHILYVLACDYARRGKLDPNTVVGTYHTNMGVERALASKGVALKRADIGDKYVLEEMLKEGALIGAEQSGHIILSEYATTGDGILSALVLARVMTANNAALADLDDAEGYAQCNVNMTVRDKIRIINNEELQEKVELMRRELGAEGRIMLRASGTEPKIRVMAECREESAARETAEKVAELIRSILSDAV